MEGEADFVPHLYLCLLLCGPLRSHLLLLQRLVLAQTRTHCRLRHLLHKLLHNLPGKSEDDQRSQWGYTKNDKGRDAQPPTHLFSMVPLSNLKNKHT